MKNNKIFDLWLSEFSFEEIAQMSNISEQSVKEQLKEHVQTLDIEEDEKYRGLWTTYNFSKEQFCNIFNESELIYNYFTLMYDKGDKHPIYLMFDKLNKQKLLKYLNTNDLVNIIENNQINVELKTKFINGVGLNENEMLEIGFIPADRYVNFFTTYNLDEDIFSIVFKLTKAEYQYLNNRFIKGENDFETFVNLDPSNEFAQRYKLQKNINALNRGNEKPSSEEKHSTINDLESKLFTLLDKTSKKFKKRKHIEIKLETFEPNLSAIFANFQPKFIQETKEVVTNVKSKNISHRSLSKLTMAHEEIQKTKSKVKLINTIDTYKQINQNVKVRFDVKKEVK